MDYGGDNNTSNKKLKEWHENEKDKIMISG